MAKEKMLTVKFPEKTLVEFHAAAEILGARTSSALIHQFAMQKIREAKNRVSVEEFDSVVKEKSEEMQNRSREKSALRGSDIIQTPDRSEDNAGLNFSGKGKRQSKSDEAELNKQIDAAIDKKKNNKKK